MKLACQRQHLHQLCTNCEPDDGASVLLDYTSVYLAVHWALISGLCTNCQLPASSSITTLNSWSVVVVMYKLQNFTWICIWQVVLPDNKCCQMWLILWLFENICGCWQKQQPRKENFSKQKLHFHHRWKCSKNLDFQATFWQSLAGPYFCKFLSILGHIWTELSFVAKIQTAKTTFMLKYNSSRWL